MKIYTVFVEPETSGNIGFLARAMKNFGLEKMVLINPCKLEDDAYYQAMHAKEIVEDALIYDSIEEFIEKEEIISVIATTGTPGGSYNIPRIPITPEELGKTMQINGNTALLFGREGDGLYNHELELADILVSIPTSDQYPIMNITHAASIIFYEIFKNKKSYPVEDMDIATYDDKRILEELSSDIIGKLDYPEHKRKQADIIVKRIMGRAFIAGREAQTLRGTLKRIDKRIDSHEE